MAKMKRPRAKFCPKITAWPLRHDRCSACAAEVDIRRSAIFAAMVVFSFFSAPAALANQPPQAAPVHYQPGVAAVRGRGAAVPRTLEYTHDHTTVAHGRHAAPIEPIRPGGVAQAFAAGQYREVTAPGITARDMFRMPRPAVRVALAQGRIVGVSLNPDPDPSRPRANASWFAEIEVHLGVLNSIVILSEAKDPHSHVGFVGDPSLRSG
jgi:hypothetical protein